MKTPTKTEQHSRLVRMRAITAMMDTQYRFLGIKFGLDSIVGLFPWIGDAIGGLISLYIIWEAYKMGIPRVMLNKMIANVVIDVFIGGVPVLGDIFDIFFKSNVRNLQMVEEYLKRI